MIPYLWEDDHYFSNYINVDFLPYPFIELQGIKVFNFHPIHVFLNTESPDRYEYTSPLHQKPAELLQHRGNAPNGTRELIKQLIGLK